MIRVEDVRVQYDGAARPTLEAVTFDVSEGDLCLVVGPTGSGKSTLLKAITGHVPFVTGGTMSGDVIVDGRSISEGRPAELIGVVGHVGQNPVAGFAADSVEAEVARGVTSLNVSPGTARKRVEEILDLLGLPHLRRRPLTTLSGGEQQRVAIGSVLALQPRVLVLDEPTSALDPHAAEEVLAALQRLVHDLGLTVVLAEHRLERVVQYADQVVLVPGDGAHVSAGRPAEMMLHSPVAPPVVKLGRLGGWSPLPLSVRDARRESEGMRRTLAAVRPSPHRPTSASTGRLLVTTRRLAVTYGSVPAVREVSMQVTAGEVVALMGRNGAGKSSLLGALGGRVPASGNMVVAGLDPREATGVELTAAVGLVPQEFGSVLQEMSVADACTAADRTAGAQPGTTARLLAELAPELPLDLHPDDLSEGQRLMLALLVVLAAKPSLVLLDEPTRGLDYGAKRRLTGILRGLAAEGRAVVLATHDVELVAEAATRVLVMAEGELVADGPTAEVVVSSPAFAPQVAKVLAPHPVLTVTDAAHALRGNDRLTP